MSEFNKLGYIDPYRVAENKNAVAFMWKFKSGFASVAAPKNYTEMDLKACLMAVDAKAKSLGEAGIKMAGIE